MSFFFHLFLIIICPVIYLLTDSIQFIVNLQPIRIFNNNKFNVIIVDRIKNQLLWDIDQIQTPFFHSCIHSIPNFDPRFSATFPFVLAPAFVYSSPFIAYQPPPPYLLHHALLFIYAVKIPLVVNKTQFSYFISLMCLSALALTWPPLHNAWCTRPYQIN